MVALEAADGVILSSDGVCPRRLAESGRRGRPTVGPKGLAESPRPTASAGGARPARTAVGPDDTYGSVVPGSVTPIMGRYVPKANDGEDPFPGPRHHAATASARTARNSSPHGLGVRSAESRQRGRACHPTPSASRRNVSTGPLQRTNVDVDSSSDAQFRGERLCVAAARLEQRIFERLGVRGECTPRCALGDRVHAVASWRPPSARGLAADVTGSTCCRFPR
jgi:hypothetical protein